MNEIYKERIAPLILTVRSSIERHKISYALALVSLIGILFAVVVLASSKKTLSLTSIDLTAYSNVTREEGRTVFSINSKKDYLYKSPSKKGLAAAREFLQINPSLSQGTLFPKDFEKNTVVTRQVLDKNDTYLKRNNIALSNEHYFFNQTINDIPVYGAIVTVHVKNENEIYTTSGNISTNSTQTTQKIIDDKAKEIALSEAKKEVAGGQLTVKTTKKYYLNERVMGLSNDSVNHLALEVEVESLGKPVVFRTRYFIDLENGRVIYSESQTRDALDRNVYNCQGGACPLQRQEGASPVSDTDVNNVYGYFGTVYDYFFNSYSRDSYDNAGASYNGYVHASNGMAMHGVPVQCPNAFWNGYEMVFCSGLVLLDVTGHELTHALTGETAGLQYVQESGALNEAVSDIFGSAMDNNWDIGEGLPSSLGLPVPLRSMSNPPSRNNPDKLSSPLFYCGAADSAHDYGGVHKNSGVINKTFYLMTDGGTFNGCTMNGIGRAKSHPIVYQALTKYLTQTSNFKDVYTTFMQACSDLYGSTSSECDNVNRAMQATELDQQPQGLPQSPVCSGGSLQPATCSAAGSPPPNPTSSVSPTQNPSQSPTPAPTGGGSSGLWKLMAMGVCEGATPEIKYDYEIPSGEKGVIETYDTPDGHASPGGLVDMSSWVTGPPYLINKGTYTAKGKTPPSSSTPLKNNFEYTAELHNGSSGLTAPSMILTFKIKTPDCSKLPSPTSAPSPAPTSGGGGYQQHGTPTPTPDQYFTCKPDPSCTKSGKNIQLCPLLCTPQ